MAVVEEVEVEISTRSKAVKAETKISELELERHRLVQQTKRIDEFVEARVAEHPMRMYSLLERDQDKLKKDRLQRDVAKLESEIKTLREGSDTFDIQNLTRDYHKCIERLAAIREDSIQPCKRAVMLINMFVPALGTIYLEEVKHENASNEASRLRVALEKHGADVSALPKLPAFPLNAHDLLKRLREGLSQPQFYKPLTEGEYPSLKILKSDSSEG